VSCSAFAERSGKRGSLCAVCPSSVAGTHLFPLGAIVGITAYAMSTYSIGGWTEPSAVFLFDTLFLLCLARAWWHGQRNEPALKRRWLLRSIAILLGIATTRPVMALFFASSPATHLVPSQFFGIAFWIGFSINVLVFELWVRSPDRRLHPTPTDARPYGSSSIQ